MLMVTKTAEEASKIIVVILLAGLTIAVGIAACKYFSSPSCEAGAAASCPVPADFPPFSVAEFQQHLKRLGYYQGDIDGKLGPHTQAAWDRWYCDSMASKDIERSL